MSQTGSLAEAPVPPRAGAAGRDDRSNARNRGGSQLSPDNPGQESAPRGGRRRRGGTERGRGHGQGHRQGRNNTQSHAPPPSEAATDDNSARPPGGGFGARLTEAASKSKGASDEPQSQEKDTDVETDDAEVCFICASPIEHVSVAPCNHQTCHICALRLRALYKTRACAHCRVRWIPRLHGY